MKFKFTYQLIRSVTLSLIFAASLPLRADLSETGGRDLYVQVGISGNVQTPSIYECSIGLYQDGFGPFMLANGQGGCSLTPQKWPIKPERPTFIRADVYQGTVWSVSFKPPAGYSLYINGQLNDTFGGHPGVNQSGATVQMLLHKDGFGGPLGEQIPLKVDTGIFWAVGLGELPNGDTAGAITINEGGGSVPTMSPALLNYGTFNPAVEVVGAMRQIKTPQALVDIRTVTGGFEVAFYPASAVSKTNGIYTWGNTPPFVVYKLTNGTGANQIQVARTTGDVVQTTTATLTPSTRTWQINTAGEKVVTKSSTAAGGDRTETTTTKDGSDHISSKIVKTFHSFPWGEELVKEVDDPDGKAYTTEYSFYTDNSALSTYTKPKAVLYPGGNWIKYEYYTDNADHDGLLKSEYHPWLDGDGVTPDTATAANCRAITYDYVKNVFGIPLEKSRIETIKGVTVGKKLTTNDMSAANAVNSHLLWSQTISTSVNGQDSLTTIVKSYHPGFTTILSGLPYSTKRSDGTMEVHAYVRGNYSGGTFTSDATGNGIKEYTITGVASAPVEGAVALTQVGGQTVDPIYLIDGESTQSVTYRQDARVMRQETYVYNGSAFSQVDWTDYAYTDSGKLSGKTSSNNTSYSATYANELKTAEIDESGIETTYTYDGLYRVKTATRTPGPGYTGAPTANIVSTYTYDGDGNVTNTEVTGGSLSLTSSKTYNLGGRMTSQTVPGNYTTSFDENLTSHTQTVTYPGQATKTATTYLDGRAKSITGTAQVSSYYNYDVDSTTGYLTTTVHQGSASSGSWGVTQADLAGRTRLSRHPDSAGNNVDTIYSYNSKDQLEKTETTGMASTLYGYTTSGALETTALDVNGNSTIDLGGTDRISQSSSKYIWDGSAWWLTSTQKIFATNGSNAATQVSKSETRRSGFPTGVVSETRATDADGNVTTQKVILDRSNRTLTSTTTSTGLSTSATQVSYNGMTMSSTSIRGVATTFGYDALGRQNKVNDPLGATVLTTYKTGSSEVDHTAFDNGTLIDSYAYGSDSRVSSTTDALGHVKSYTYNARGQVTRVDGTGTLPVEYTFDAFGRMQTQKTYSAAGEGTTTFAYYGDLPLLYSRQDSVNPATSRTYDALGRVSTLTNSRGIVTHFSYDSATGDLLTRTYTSDPYSTPSITYTYQRSGLIATVTDALGVRSFDYNTALHLEKEHLPSFYGSNRTETSVYDTANMMGRITALQLGTTSNASAYQTCGYGYFGDGRLQTLTAQGSGFSSYSFSYAYTANADNLVASVSNSSSGYTLSRTYDPQYRQANNVTGKYGTVIKTQYDYTYTSLGQRATGAQSGQAFASYGNSTNYTYTYDAVGQLKSALADLGGTAMPDRKFEFSYDNAGNRTSANRTGVSTDAEAYTPNALNQIETKQNLSVPLQGSVSPGTKVVAQNTLAGMAGNYWALEAKLANASGPVQSTIAITAFKPGGPSGIDTASTINKTIFLPARTESLGYDADGNLTSDGQWTYVWNAENQLISMATATAAKAAGLPNTVVQFNYDYLGRRIQKVVSINGVQQSEQRYIYFGWNVAAETDAAGTIQRHFIWGLDITGTASGAGGVGGLLMVQDSTHTYFPTYDGNGNVAAMLDAANGSLTAIYEYDPFGRLLHAEGAYASANPFRFSTKWADDETGLLYYGYRYYNPFLGRFINRDPIGEEGGVNLYGFCSNDSVNRWDMLGNDDGEVVALNKVVITDTAGGDAGFGAIKNRGDISTFTASLPTLGWERTLTLTEMVRPDTARYQQARLALQRFLEARQRPQAKASILHRLFQRSVGRDGITNYGDPELARVVGRWLRQAKSEYDRTVGAGAFVTSQVLREILTRQTLVDQEDLKAAGIIFPMMAWENMVISGTLDEGIIATGSISEESGISTEQVVQEQMLEASDGTLGLNDIMDALKRLDAKGLKASDAQGHFDPDTIIRLAEKMRSGEFTNELMDQPVIRQGNVQLSGHHRTIAAEITDFPLEVKYLPAGSVEGQAWGEVPLIPGRRS